jgi:hypothetical protein
LILFWFPTFLALSFSFSNLFFSFSIFIFLFYFFYFPILQFSKFSFLFLWSSNIYLSIIISIFHWLHFLINQQIYFWLRIYICNFYLRWMFAHFFHCPKIIVSFTSWMTLYQSKQITKSYISSNSKKYTNNQIQTQT